MKLAGVFMGFLGGWMLATMFGGLVLVVSGEMKLRYIDGVMLVSPFTAAVAVAIGCIATGVWLYDKRQ